MSGNYHYHLVLPEGEASKARAKAAQKRISFKEYIRRLIQKDLKL